VDVDPATTSVYLDSPDLTLFRSRLRRDDGAVALRLRVYADDALADEQSGTSSKVFVERKTHREQEESVKERFNLETSAADALLSAHRFAPETLPIQRLTENVLSWLAVFSNAGVTAESLGVKPSRKASDGGAAADRRLTLASEVVQLVRAQRLGPVVTTRYRRVCYQHTDDDRLRISLDRDFIMIREEPSGRAGSGW